MCVCVYAKQCVYEIISCVVVHVGAVLIFLICFSEKFKAFQNKSAIDTKQTFFLSSPLVPTPCGREVAIFLLSIPNRSIFHFFTAVFSSIYSFLDVVVCRRTAYFMSGSSFPTPKLLVFVFS